MTSIRIIILMTCNNENLKLATQIKSYWLQKQ